MTDAELIAEEMIGRYLKDDEVVHHINEIKTDNRKENLKVMTKSEHIEFHQSQKKRGKDGKYKI